MSGSRTALAAGILLLLAPGAGALRAQSPDPAGAAAYVAYGCYQCHGYAGQGGAAGPRLAPSPYPLTAFAALIRRPVNVMPAYAPENLDAATLAGIYRYIQSLPPPAAADPLLR